MSLQLGSLAHVTLYLIGVFALFHFVLVPRARRSARNAGVEARPGAAALYAASEFLRSATLVMTLGAIFTVLVFLLSSALIDYRGAGTMAAIRSGLAVVRGWREMIAAINPFYSVLVIGAIVFAFAVLAWRSSKRKVSESRDRARRAELDRVLKAKQAGAWDERPPTEMMQTVAKGIAERIEFLAISEQLEEAWRTNDQEVLSNFNPMPIPAQLKEAKERVSNEVARLQLQHEILDAERRMAVDSSTPELEVAPPNTFKERVLTFFASRGLLNVLSAGQRALLLAALLLLIPGHLALTAPTLDGLLAAREVRLSDAAVTVSAEEATKSWERTLMASAVPSIQQQALTAEDEEAIRGAAQAFEQALVRGNAVQLTRSLGSGAQTTARRFASVRADEVRREIISAIQQRRGGAADAQRAAEAMPGLHREVMHFEGTLKELGNNGTPIYQFAESNLREAAMRSRSFREHLKAAWGAGAQSFQQLDSHSQLTARLVSNLMAPGAHFGGELGELGHVFDAAAGNAFRERVYKAQMAAFMSSIDTSSNLSTAMDSVSHLARDGLLYTRSEVGRLQAVAVKVPGEEVIVRAYEEHAKRTPPSFREPPPAAAAPPGILPRPGTPGGGNAARAEQILNEYAAKTYAGRAIPEEFGNAFASYTDYFPAHSTDALATRMASARVAASEATAVGGQAAAQAARATMAKQIAAEGAKLASMSRNYVKLSGFRRVGGVLIGREPEKTDKPLDFRDLSWSLEAGKVRLVLTRGDGRRFTLGPYSPNVVLPALGYAADQRPTAVTMVTAAPLRELKILVHPALEDTPIGCRAIEIDRFVDVTTSKNDGLGKRRKRTDEDFEAARTLYSATRQQAIEAAMATASTAQKGVLNQIKDERFDPALLQSALQLGASIFDAKRTPLTAKPAYFDRQVVELMNACVKPGTRPDAYLSCVRREAAGKSLSFSGNWGWSAPTPQTQEWSGVREQAYALDPDLKFAGAGQADKTAPWPFDFIIQVAFTKPAFALRTSRPWFDDENIDVLDYVDEQPWLYHEMQADLTAAVIQDIRNNREWSDIYSNLRDYVLLQRLFRAALSDQLGERLPVDKLAALTKAAAPLTRNEATPRWNVKPGSIELRFSSLIQESKQRLDGNPKYTQLTRGIDQCLALIGASASSSRRLLDLARIDQNRWAQVCNFEPMHKTLFGTEPGTERPTSGIAASLALAAEPEGDRIAKLAINQSIQTSYARDLRRTLGVDREDERLFAERKSCGPL